MTVFASRPTVRTVAADGTGAVWLDQIGRVFGLTYASSYPGGPVRASWQLDAAADLQHAGLLPGRTVQVFRGTQVAWAGVLTQPERGQPWRCQADGLASFAGSSVCAATGTLDSIVDAAITRGLPWTRPATLGAFSWAGSVGSDTLDKALTNTLSNQAKAWRLSPAGALTAETPPAAPTYLVRLIEPISASLTDYATVVVARYQSSSTATATVTVINAAAKATFGYREKPLDLTDQGVITSSSATTMATNYLAATAPRLRVTSSLTVMDGQITTTAGVPVDPALVTAGFVARVRSVTSSRDALVAPQQAFDVTIGEVEYSADTAVLTLTPSGDSRNDLVSVLARAA